MAPILVLALLAQGQLPSMDNLNFERANLAGWKGEGFYLTTADPRGPGPRFGVCSSDGNNPGRTGTLQRDIIVPRGADWLECEAFAARIPGSRVDFRLGVEVRDSANVIVPKLVQTGTTWASSINLLETWQQRSRKYIWNVSNLVGQRLTLSIVDHDDRPGCYTFCSGFKILQVTNTASKRGRDASSTGQRDDNDGPGVSIHGSKNSGTSRSNIRTSVAVPDFASHMLGLQKSHQLAPFARYDSDHFVAIGNADDSFMRQRVRYCEIFHDLFFAHFQRAGFQLHQPTGKLMIAIFDSQEGFEAYLGQKMPAAITGIYHPASNRLLLYDVNLNRGILANKKRVFEKTTRIASAQVRQSVTGTLERQFDDLVKDINLSTTMHEAAHQLSFNTGMLSRHADIPFWLAEGLACYCEATDQGDWQALGSLHPGRIHEMRQPSKNNRLIPLARLVKGDAHTFHNPGLAYAQSWALFHLLMRERLPQLRAYLKVLPSRRTPDHRVTDFFEAFGPNPGALEQRYANYIHQLVQTTPPPRPR